MATTNDRFVVGLFDDSASADNVERELRDADFSTDTIGSTRTGKSRGVVDQLKKHGVPDDHAHFYAEGVRRGGCLVTVNTDVSHHGKAVEIMRRHGAVDMNQRGAYYRQQGFTRHDESAPAYNEHQIKQERHDFNQAASTLPIIEEEVHVGKERTSSGGVRIFQRETEVPVEKDVTVRQEHVDVQRRNVNRPATEEDLAAFKEGEVVVRETSERPVISKETKVTGEVSIGKHAEEHTETVRDTAKKRDVEVERIEEERRRNPAADRR